LVDALRNQMIVHGDVDVANRLANVASLAEFAPEKQIIAQDGEDTDIYFILAGRASVIVHGREVAIRAAGVHVGEMAMIDPRARRCASVVAMETTVVAKLTEQHFTTIAKEYPYLWRRISLELADRLRERNGLVRPPNPRPVLFVGSSAEMIAVVREVHNQFAHDDIVVRPWTTDVFGASKFPVEDLEDEVKRADFALLVVTPDDKVRSRHEQSDAPRDNVVFELGLFMGQLWRPRTFMLQPRGVDLKIPTDLLGIKALEYKPPATDADLPSALGPPCNELREIIKARKTR
jgi:CRP/FNR family cyclic AMP-dependent transcriptional regulator